MCVLSIQMCIMNGIQIKENKQHFDFAFWNFLKYDWEYVSEEICVGFLHGYLCEVLPQHDSFSSVYIACV